MSPCLRGAAILPKFPSAASRLRDGRRCYRPAHPDYDGLCYSHGTVARRASRQNNLHHVLEPLANGRSSKKARLRALKGMARAMGTGCLSPQQANTLTRISVLIDQSPHFADEESFTSKSGPAWDRVRQAIDELDAYRDAKKH